MVIEYLLEWVHSAPVSKRVEAVRALVRTFVHQNVTDEDREEIEAAITTLTDDAAPTVRYEIAKSFGAHPSAPRHIISALANDSLEISTLVLSQSPVFHDAELVVFAEKGTEKQQISVACRPWVSAKLASDICALSCRDAAYALLMNPVVKLIKGDLHQLANRFGSDANIRNILIENPDLPANTRLLLIEKLSNSLGELAHKKAWLSKEKAGQVVSEAYDKVSILLAATSKDTDVRALVKLRIQENRLTPAYLLRAVCMGNINLVAHALSELSGVGFGRVETVLAKNRQSAMCAIYDRAGLPTSAFQIFLTAISTWRELLRSKNPPSSARLPYLVTKQVLAVSAISDTEIVDELLVLLRKLSAEAAREGAKSKAYEIVNRDQAQAEAEVALENENEEKSAPVEIVEPVEEYNGIDPEKLYALAHNQNLSASKGSYNQFDEFMLFEAPPIPKVLSKEYIGNLSEEDFAILYGDLARSQAA